MADVLDKPALGAEDVSEDNLLDGLLAEKDKELPEKEVEEEVEEEPELIEEAEIEPDVELVDTNLRAVDFTKIKEKYTDFAKTNEFKELRNAYHRESQYTELFPTLEDAKEAAENNETFVKLNDDIVNRGDATSLLNAVKEASPESFKKVATSFLDTLAKMDNNLYVEAVSPVIKRAARQIYNDGQKILKRNAESDDGKALVATARNIMLHFFEDADAIDKDEPRADPKIAEKEQELSQRERAIAQEKLMGAYNVCDASAEKNLDKMIIQGLDPDGKFNDFTRDTLVEKIKNEVKNQINKDQLHVRRMTSLWKRAEQEGYNRESLSRIVSAYLERARPIIPTVRNKFRSIAIKGKTQQEEPDNSDRSVRIRNKGQSGRAPANDGRINVRNVDHKKVDYRQTSDEDIFDGKVKLRGTK